MRSTGTHAAGVVITAEPLSQLVPLERSKGTSAIQTQYEDKSLEKLGLLKFDFLGLSNLTILDEALKLIKTSRGSTSTAGASRSTTRRPSTSWARVRRRACSSWSPQACVVTSAT